MFLGLPDPHTVFRPLPVTLGFFPSHFRLPLLLPSAPTDLSGPNVKTSNGINLALSVLKRIHHYIVDFIHAQVGDVILKVSGAPLSSLSLRQALDILRSSPPLTTLQVK
jgi:hypothetical protein